MEPEDIFSTPVDTDLLTGLCLLTYEGRYIKIPTEVWRFHGFKILTWFDYLYDNQVTYLKHSQYEQVTLVLPYPLSEQLNIEEFLVWAKLTYE